MNNLKSVLVTGGTGSFGKRFIKRILAENSDISRVVVYSRDELKQYDMANDLELKPFLPKMRFFIGDVRDFERLKMAMEGIDVVVHAAALKQVPAAEYNPMECIKTNILGAENVVMAAIFHQVKKVVALSTDKAAAPVNLYGATKLCSDKLFVAANNMKGHREMTFSVVRYGNVMGSRGSVIPYFLEQAKFGMLPITDVNMTRFNITLDQGVDMVLYAIKNAWGGEIFVPKIPSYRIVDVANAISPNSVKKVVGIRPGEKLHEEMITETDSYNTVDCGKYFVILPSSSSWQIDDYLKAFNANYVTPGFKYNSGSNTEWLSVDEIRQLVQSQAGSSFDGGD